MKINRYYLTKKDFFKTKYFNNFFKAKGKAVGVGAETAWNKRRVLHAYALIGTTKSEFIMLKQLKKIAWEKRELEFIFELKRLNHDNLTNFLGIYYNEGDKFYLCHNLVERGTLEVFFFIFFIVKTLFTVRQYLYFFKNLGLYQ